MNSGKYVFSQLLQFIDRYEFDKCVEKYNGDFRTREFNCWNLFVQLLFGQLTSRNSLRDICVYLKAHQNKLYHLGIRKYVNQSTLSRANEGRDYRIFSDFGNYLIGKVRPLYSKDRIAGVDIASEVFALDSTTISLSLKLFSWAPGKYSRGAVKVHTLLDLRGSIPAFILVTDGKYHDSNVLDNLITTPDSIYIMDRAYIDFAALQSIDTRGAYFITRAKSTMDFSVIESNFNIDLSTGLLADHTIVLNGYKSKKLYPEPLRLVRYYDQEKEVELLFLANNFDVSALEITRLYRHRWQIEVFFKWIKQNLVIKSLWGHSENAVNIHIWTAICTYLIIALVKHTLKSSLSIYEIMQILGVSAFDKTPLNELIAQDQKNQNVKEQNLWNLFDTKT